MSVTRSEFLIDMNAADERTQHAVLSCCLGSGSASKHAIADNGSYLRRRLPALTGVCVDPGTWYLEPGTAWFAPARPIHGRTAQFKCGNSDELPLNSDGL